VIDRAAYGQKKSLEDLVSSANKESIDLLRRLLQFNPNKRMTADDALNHSYVGSFHNKKEEIVKGYDVVPQLDDNVRLTVDEYRNKLYSYIRSKSLNGNNINSANHINNKPKNEYYNNNSNNNNSKYNDSNQNSGEDEEGDSGVSPSTPPTPSPPIDEQQQKYNNTNQNRNNSRKSSATPNNYIKHPSSVAAQIEPVSSFTSISNQQQSYQRRKHSTDYEQNDQLDRQNTFTNSKFLGSGSTSGLNSNFSGVAFGRTTNQPPPQPQPQPQLNNTNNSYARSQSKQRALAAIMQRQKSVDNDNINNNNNNNNGGLIRTYSMQNTNNNFYQQNRSSNSAPTPNQLVHTIHHNTNSRPISSTNTNHINPAGYYNNNNNNNNNNYNQRGVGYGNTGPIIMKHMDNNNKYSTNNNTSVIYRPISATDLRPASSSNNNKFGRKQFYNQTNMTANLAAKNLFGNAGYSGSNNSVITTNGLNAIKKWL
jgi:hypothetical protein